MVTKETRIFARKVFLLCARKARPPWRIADNCVEAVGFHDLEELGVPVEDVDALTLLVIKEAQLLVLVEIWADEGVAAFDVVAKIGKGAFAEELEIFTYGLF